MSLPVVVARWSAGLLAVAYLWVSERVFRADKSWSTESSGDQANYDAGTTRLVAPFFVGSVFLPPWIGQFLLAGSEPVSLAAYASLIGVMLLGCALRWFSMHALSKSFSRTLRVHADQTVVDWGPYALIRHPGYAANFMVVLPALWLATQSLGLLLVWLLAAAYFYGRRVEAEEAMLLAALPKYRDYCLRTKRFIPFVY